MDGLVSWRGADLTTELYIGNVSLDVTVEDARAAIREMGVGVVELEPIRRHHHFQSFRLRLRKADVEKIKNPDFWPDGIVIRRFFRGKGKSTVPSVGDSGSSSKGVSGLSEGITADGRAMSS